MPLTGYEVLFFFLLAFTAMVMGVFVITARAAVHSALFLISTLAAIAGLFVLLKAEFIAGVQILVYVGGVMVLFLFVIMLVSTQDEMLERTRIFTRQIKAASAVMVLLVLLLFSMITFIQQQPRDKSWLALAKPAAEAAAGSEGPARSISQDTRQVGLALYRDAALPFEIASVLLLVAIVGSVMLARSAKQEKYFD